MDNTMRDGIPVRDVTELMLLDFIIPSGERKKYW